MMIKTVSSSAVARRLLIAGVLGLTVAFDSIINCALALNLRATPFISLSGGWDSNITSVADNQVSDTVFRASPGLILSTDIWSTTINLSGSANMEFYVNNPDMNLYERSGIFGLNTSRPIRATEKLSITPEARYTRSTSMYVRNSNAIGAEFQVLSNEPLPAASTNLTEFGAGLNVNYRASLGTEAYMTGMVTRDLYSAAGMVDVTRITGTLGITTRLSPRVRIGPSVSGDRSSFSNGEDAQFYSGALNVLFDLSDFSSFTAAGGVTRWITEGDPLAPGRQDGYSPYGSLGYTYHRDTWHLSLGAAYRTQPVGGVVSVAESISGYVSVTKTLAPAWFGSIASSYVKNTNVNAAGQHNDNWFNLASIRYQVSENASLFLSGTHMYTEYITSGGATNEVNRVNAFLGVDVRKTYTIF